MMPQMNQNSNQDDSVSPLDDIISQVQSYVKNPALATKDTLSQLLSDLEGFKSYMDEESKEGGDEEPADNQKPGGLAVMISGRGK